MLFSSTSGFDSLVARPPTPPRDTIGDIQDALIFLRHDITSDRRSPALRPKSSSTTTPPDSSPLSSRELEQIPARKKVGFLPVPTYLPLPRSGFSSSPRDPASTPDASLPISKPAKSILKLSNLPLPATPEEQEPRLSYFSPEEPGSFAKMLSSVLRQLAASSRHSRLDAYLALNGALTAYDGIPDRESISQHIGSVLQFLTRDMTARDPSGSLDANMVVQAAKLAGCILIDEHLSKLVDNDFRAFLTERSIAVLEHDDMPKQVLKVHMGLLTQQRSSASVMTSSRVDKVVSALQTIGDRCSGNGVVNGRLMIYRRLMDQASSTMLARMRDWLEHVLHGMLSDTSETRTRATEICSHAGTIYGTSSSASKTLQELLETKVEDGSSYFEYFSSCLVDMIRKPGVNVYVPQIWSAMVLFHRNKKQPLERWSRFRSWLRVIEKCLNASDLVVRCQANVAWRKLVFAVLPDASTSPSMMKILKVPICLGFLKNGADKASKDTRQLALSGYYNLLHYALRPGLSVTELNTAWDCFVKQPLSDMIKASSKGRQIACRVLLGLLTPNAGAWNMAAALEEEVIQPQDLPRLDPRWTRSHLADILPMAESVAKPALWLSEDAYGPAKSLWLALVQSVSEAGAQEVKISTELKEAIALFVNAFHQLCLTCSSAPSGTEASLALNRLRDIMSYTCERLGLNHFTEDILQQDPDNRTFAAPSRSDRPNGADKLQAPLAAMLTFLCQADDSKLSSLAVSTVASDLLSLFKSTKATSTARVRLLARTWQALSVNCNSQETSPRLASFWELIANAIAGSISDPRDAAANQEATILSQQVQDVNAVLLSGAALVGPDTSALGAQANLCQSVLRKSELTAGEASAALLVTEPLSKSVKACGPGMPVQSQLNLATSLLQATPWPDSRLALDQAKKALLRTVGTRKSTSADPYDHLYHLVNAVSKTAFEEYDGELVAPLVAHFLDSMTCFLRKCPVPLQSTVLFHFQGALAVWIKGCDEAGRLSKTWPENISRVWQDVLALVQCMATRGSTLLATLEHLIAAGFMSSRRDIVIKTVGFWNDTFGSEDNLLYPASLQKILGSLQPHVELSLPGFSYYLGEDSLMVIPAFAGSRDDVDDAEANRRGDQSANDASCAHENMEVETDARPGQKSDPVKDAQRPPSRARHDDSQVQFAPIDASSPMSTNESQLLTDLQREVRDRQLAHLQMFPEMSSSPMAQSTALHMQLPRRLDFLDGDTRLTEGGFGPPAGPDETDVVDEYIGSSPTPSSSRHAHDHRELPDENFEFAEELSSSPPRPLDNGNEISSNPFVEPAPGLQSDNGAPQTGVADDPKNASDDAGATADVLDEPDIPSDSALPDAQLQMEAEAAESQGLREEEQSQVDASVEEGVATGEADVEPVVRASTNEQSEGQRLSPSSEDVARVANSFIVHSPDTAEQASPSETGSQRKRTNAQKRKRSSPSIRVTKKAKQKSSMGRDHWRQPAVDDDEDIGEEIIVASSQPSSSPAKGLADTELEASGATAAPTSQAVTASFDQNANTQETQIKRKVGRPRKTQLAVAQPPVGKEVGSLKRNSSVVSEASTNPDGSEAGRSAKKLRKHRDGHDTGSTRALRSLQLELEPTETRSRQATGVVVPRTPSHLTELERTSEDAVDDRYSGDSQARDGRVLRNSLFSPSGILERLKEVLEGCKRAVLKAREEREIDDALFEIRKAAHEAGQRGRDV